MILALSGFMGAGKTSTGKALAERLSWPFADLDELCEAAAGKTVPEVFASLGEDGFRSLEFDSLKKVLNRYADGNLVLALGGGTLCRPEARALVKGACLCIYLKADSETLSSNLEDSVSGRPVLGAAAGDTLRQRVRSLLGERSDIYEDAADLTVQVSDLPPGQAARTIERLLIRDFFVSSQLQ